MGQKRAQGTISEFDSPLFVSGTWIGAHSDTMNWLFLRCLTGRVVSSEACQPSGLTRSTMRGRDSGGRPTGTVRRTKIGKMRLRLGGLNNDRWKKT